MMYENNENQLNDSVLSHGLDHTTERYGSADELDPATLSDDKGNIPGTTGTIIPTENPDIGEQDNVLDQGLQYTEQRFNTPEESDPHYQAKQSDEIK